MVRDSLSPVATYLPEIVNGGLNIHSVAFTEWSTHFAPLSHRLKFEGNLNLSVCLSRRDGDSRPISRSRDANVNLTSFTPDLAGEPTDSFRG